MNKPRKFIYTLQLRYVNKPPAYVTVATDDESRLDAIVNKNKVWWEQRAPIRNWIIKDVDRNTPNLNQVEYDELLMNVDAVDDPEESILADRPEAVPLIPEMPESFDVTQPPPAPNPVLSSLQIQQMLERGKLDSE